MGNKRMKACRRTLAFYRQFYGVSPPYTAVIDGTFAKAALKYKVSISEQLPRYLDAEVRIHTTKCVLKECEALGSLLYGPLVVLRQFSVLPCLHKNPVKPSNCLLMYAKQDQKSAPQRYMIGTQDEILSNKVRELPGSPLLFISHANLLLEAPSNASREGAEKENAGNSEWINCGDPQIEALRALKKKILGEKVVTKEKLTKKRKGPKGPNPLSCKKKKKNVNSGKSSTSEEHTAKRKRRKRRTPGHAKILNDS